MSTGYQIYFQIIVKIVNLKSDRERQNILHNQHTFCQWASQNNVLALQASDHHLYFKVKEFIERTCCNLRFTPNIQENCLI